MLHEILASIRNIDLIEDLFFKKRVLFAIHHDEYGHQTTPNEQYYAKSYSGKTVPKVLDRDLREFLYNRLGRQRVNDRLDRSEIVLCVALEHSTQEPAGYYWGVVPDEKPIWHDSFRVPTGDGLVFGAYVKPEHRRNGVYSLLQSEAHNYLFSCCNADNIYTLVENRNTASMRANSTFGLKQHAKNYLLKLFSLNVISIYKTENQTSISIVLGKGNI